MKRFLKSSLGRVCVLGLGVSGKAVLHYLEALPASRVDEIVALENVEKVEGFFGTIIISPGIAPSTPLFQSALAATNNLISEIEFAYRESRCRWVAITGTNGKTTTTALAAHVLNSCGVEAYAVGNIGVPAIEMVGSIDADAILVAEVSSFQLATTLHFSPSVAAILNITPDHLNWHENLEHYVRDKCKVLRNLDPGSLALLNAQDDYFAREYEVAKLKGAGVRAIDVRNSSTDPLPEMRIKGVHNCENALFAREIARYFELDEQTIGAALSSFEPVRHRLQYAGTINGATWYNDSKATNPDAALKAIASFPDTDLIVLVGGRNKGSSFSELGQAVVSSARVAICFGEAREELAGAFDSFFNSPAQLAESMRGAMSLALDLAQPNSVVLLTPACASFDEFDNFEHRGEVFCSFVNDHADAL